MDNIFNIVESTPNLTMMFTVVLCNKFNITVGKNENNVFIYFNKIDGNTKYVGKIDTEEYQTIKNNIIISINNVEIRYIEGYADNTLKEILSNYGFEYYNEDSSYMSIFKIFKYA